MTNAAFIFSSTDFPDKDRVDIWREMFARKIAGFDVEHADSRPFFNQTRFHSFGHVNLAAHTSTAVRFRRTRELITGDGLDDYLGLSVCVAGIWEVMQGQRRMLINRSTAGLVDSTKVLDGGFGPDSPEGYQELLSLRISRSELTKRVPKAERLVMTPLCNSEGIELLRNYLQMLDRGGVAQDPSLGELVGNHIVDLIAFLCNDEVVKESHSGGVRAARQAAVIRYLEKHFSEPGLNAAQIAGELRISRRYLFDLLNETGESVTQILNRLRIARACRLLADPKFRHLDIAAIAFQSGFNDLSYFYRQFRQQFQEPPGAFRARRALQNNLDSQTTEAGNTEKSSLHPLTDGKPSS
ncbi:MULTISPECIES: helix-turn-helix domain-containing protein [Methylomonas]|uniref:HTH araC/xylS-type domain-containing protein n=1 Tax=Methylomonas koyamae TaxID=702114 RepID=A0A177NWJ0_9GAMM|nr:helix-turn-helix domain-containing protein [Methylomonas koyamae]OAI22417.1 hypothetical protein A1355_02055 [Methylomonas koyamae]